MRRKLLAAMAMAGLVALAACGERTDTGTSETGNNGNSSEVRAHFFGEVADSQTGTPRDTLNFAAFQEPINLDPIRALGTGTSGGIELHAIYDTLLTYDPETLEYAPRLAESFSFNEDGTELTLTLRPGLTFTDGTPLDADAVIFSLQRHVNAPSRFGSAVAEATTMTAVDERTVVLNFDAPSYGFLGDLTNLPGTVVSPTAVEELGDDAFGNTPVGAGPYMLENWEPGQELVLTANPNYWGGEPPTKTLRFVYLGSMDTALDSLKSGAVDMMFTREADISGRLLAESAGFVEPTAMAQMVFMNANEGNATEDVRLRKAIVHAIDPSVINERAYEGHAIPSKSFIPEGAALHGASTQLEYDPDEASRLVDEVKADGEWDGSIDLMCDQTPQERDVCQALQGMFEAVGITTNTEYRRDKATQVWAQRDYEVSLAYMAMPDTDISAGVWNNFGSTSGTNPFWYKNPSLDEAARELRGAETVDEQRAALAKIQQAFDEDPPIAMLSTMATTTAWNDNVTGVVPSGAYTVFLDKVIVTDN